MGTEQLMVLLTSERGPLRGQPIGGQGNGDTSLGSHQCREFTEPQLSKNNKFSFKI